MTSPFRCAVRACLTLFAFAAIVFVFANRPLVYASNSDARGRGAIAFHTKGCERCHAITGVGGDRAPDLGSVGQRRAPAQIKTQILKGGHGMPPFGNVLSKEEVKDLVAFLTTCRTDAALGCRQLIPADAPQ
jgi:mono/diheme cytochrome c family protein